MLLHAQMSLSMFWIEYICQSGWPAVCQDSSLAWVLCDLGEGVGQMKIQRSNIVSGFLDSPCFGVLTVCQDTVQGQAWLLGGKGPWGGEWEIKGR